MNVAKTGSKLLIHPTVWMTLQGKTLSEKSQPQKVAYSVIPFTKKMFEMMEV